MKKRITAALVAAWMIGTVAIAQPADAPRRGHPSKTEMIKHQTDDMVQRYGLNETQAAKLLELNTKYADQLRPMRGPGGPEARHGRRGNDVRPDSTTRRPPEMTAEQRAKMDAERKKREAAEAAYEKELKTILTADQYKKYEADKKKRRPHGPHGPRHGHR